MEDLSLNSDCIQMTTDFDVVVKIVVADVVTQQSLLNRVRDKRTSESSANIESDMIDASLLSLTDIVDQSENSMIDQSPYADLNQPKRVLGDL